MAETVPDDGAVGNLVYLLTFTCSATPPGVLVR